MHERDDFPTVSERISSWGQSARAVVEQGERKAQRDSIDPASVPRDQSVLELLQNEIKATMKRATGKRLENAVSLAINNVVEDLTFEGVELRHPELWFRHSIEMVAAQVAAMKYRNLEQRQIIDEHLLRFVIAEAQDLELEELSLEELDTPIKLRNYLNEAFYGVDDQDDEEDNEPGERSSTPFADNLEDLLYRELYLPLDDNSKATIEQASHIGVIYNTLNERFREVRKPNDCKVQYGTVWSPLHVQQFHELYEKLGGVDGAAVGIAMKHLGDPFEVLGTRFGILDRVPKEEQGELAHGRPSPLRVYLRTSQQPYSPSEFPFERLGKELEEYRRSKESIYFDYSSPEALLDEGWALD